MRRKIKFIQSVLDQYFPNPPIPLQHKDPYTLLIAVVLSAQNTDDKVNKVTPRLFKLADSPEKMAQCDPKIVEEIIRPCGLARTKSQSLVNLSQKILQDFAGKVPQSIAELKTLPGVGQKTASVVVSQAFQIPAFAVDTHIHRCLHRWGISDGTSVEKTESDAKRVFPKKDWIKTHLQIIYFARKFCPARKHDVESCPICRELLL